MQKPKKGALPPKEQMSREELQKLIDRGTEADWQKVDASLDAEIEAMSPEEREKNDREVELLQWRILKLLKDHGHDRFN